jgi:uncharacterized membrane protein YkoI
VTALAAAATMSVGAVLPAAAQAGQCLSDQQIQAEIAAGQIKSWPKIKSMAGISKKYEEVSDVRVCLRGGIPYYSVNVVSPNGDATKIVVNAVDGSR